MQTITAGATSYGSWSADTPGTVGPGALTYTANATTNVITPASSMASLPDGHAVHLSNVGGSAGGDNSAYVSAVNALSPSAYLRLADASDEVGTYSWTNSGASFGASSLITGDNGAATFNGSAYMFASISDPSWTSLTVIAWVKPSAAADNQTIAGGHAGSGGWVLKLMDDHLQFESTSFSYDVSTTFAYSGGDVLQVAVTFNNSDKTARFYVNGVAKGTAVLPSNLFTGAILAIGTAYGLGAAFTGDIDEVAIYGNQQLSGAAILADYELGLEAADPPGGFPEGLNGNDRYFGRWTTEGAGPYHLYATAADAIAGTNAIDITSAGDGTNTITPEGTGATPMACWLTPQRHIVRGVNGTASRTIGLYADHINGIDYIEVKLDNGTALTLTSADLIQGSDDYTMPADRTCTADASTNAITLASALSDNTTYVTAVRFTTTGTLPGGLTADTWYYTRFTSLTVTKLFPTAWDATQNSNAIDITSAGSGTHTIRFHESTRTGYWFLLPADLSSGFHALRAYIYPNHQGTVRVLQGVESSDVGPSWTLNPQAHSLQVYGDLSDALDYYAVVSGTGSDVGTPAIKRLSTDPDPSAVTVKYGTVEAAYTALSTHRPGGRIYVEASTIAGDCSVDVDSTLPCLILPMTDEVPGSLVFGVDLAGQNVVACWLEYKGCVFDISATDIFYWSAFTNNHRYNRCVTIGAGIGSDPAVLLQNVTNKNYWVTGCVNAGIKGGSWFVNNTKLVRGASVGSVTGDQFSAIYYVFGAIDRDHDQVGMEHADFTQFLGDKSNFIYCDIDVDIGSGNDINAFYQGDASATFTDGLYCNIRVKGSGSTEHSMEENGSHLVFRHCTFASDPLLGAGIDGVNCEFSGCIWYSVTAGAQPSPPTWDAAAATSFYKRVKWQNNHNVSSGTHVATQDTTGAVTLSDAGRIAAGSALLRSISTPVRKFDLRGVAVATPDDVGAFGAVESSGPAASLGRATTIRNRFRRRL